MIWLWGAFILHVIITHLNFVSARRQLNILFKSVEGLFLGQIK